MATKMTPREEPCTSCGQAVTRVEIYSDAAGHGRGKRAAAYEQHSEHMVMGDKVDDECTQVVD
jgi:hypothetical protein